MNPDTVSTITQIATVLGPAIVAFLAGHFHIIPGTKPTTPATPGTPATPAVPAIRPIGQGGILDVLGMAGNAVAPPPGAPLAPVGRGGILQLVGLLVQSILTSPGTTKAKVDAVAAVVTAAEPFAETSFTDPAKAV